MNSEERRIFWESKIRVKNLKGSCGDAAPEVERGLDWIRPLWEVMSSIICIFVLFPISHTILLDTLRGGNEEIVSSYWDPSPFVTNFPTFRLALEAVRPPMLEFSSFDQDRVCLLL